MIDANKWPMKCSQVVSSPLKDLTREGLPTIASKAKFTNAFHQVTLLLAITEFAAAAAASKV